MESTVAEFLDEVCELKCDKLMYTHVPYLDQAAVSTLDPQTESSEAWGLDKIPNLLAAYPSPPYDSTDSTSTMAVSPSYSSYSGNDPVMVDIAVDFDDLLDVGPLGEVVFEKLDNDVNSSVSVPNTQENNVLDEADWLSDSSSPSQHALVTQLESAPRRPMKVVTVAETNQYVLRPRHAQGSIGTFETNTIKRPAKYPPPKANKISQKRTYSEMEELDTEDDKNSKAAIQARVNRQKKKAYIHGLESQVEALSKENATLKSDSNKLKKERNLFCEEVAYLRGVLKNDSMLSELLSNMTSLENVRLSSSFASGSASHQVDHDYGRPSKVPARASKKSAVQMSSGVCLHVDSGNVSLEFCSKCAMMSKGADRSVLQS